MPSGVFKPYAGVSTAILIFTKTGTGDTERVWFYDMKSDGFSLDDKREPLEGAGDIEDIVARFSRMEDEEGRARTEQSFLVPVDEIRANGYDLSINKYKEIEYTPVEYPSTTELMEQIDALNEEYKDSIQRLKTLLGKQV